MYASLLKRYKAAPRLDVILSIKSVFSMKSIVFIRFLKLRLSIASPKIASYTCCNCVKVNSSGSRLKLSGSDEILLLSNDMAFLPYHCGQNRVWAVLQD